MSDIEAIRSLVLHLAQHLVDRPDEVIVEAVEKDLSILIHLKVGTGEVGKIIGKQGRTARCLRTILGGAAMKSKRGISLNIVED